MWFATWNWVLFRTSGPADKVISSGTNNLSRKFDVEFITVNFRVSAQRINYRYRKSLMFSASHKERAFQLPWRPSTLSKSLAILPFKFDYKFFCIPMRFSAWNCIKVYIFSDRLYETEGSYKIRLVHSLQRVNIPHGRCLLTLIKKSRPQEGRYTKTRSTCENLYISLLRLLQIRRLD